MSDKREELSEDIEVSSKKSDSKEVTVKSKNCNNISLIILIIILCLCSFAFGFCMNFKYTTNNYNSTSNQKNLSTSKSSNESYKNGTTECEADGYTIENLDITDPEVQKAIDDISIGLDKYCGVWDMYSTGVFNSSDISNELAFRMVVANMSKYGREFKEGSEISKESFDASLASILGKDYKFTEYKTFNTCPSYTWDANKQAWVEGVSACGGTCGPHDLKKIVKAHKAGDTLTIYVRVIFTDNTGNTIKYFSDSNMTKEIAVDKDYDGFIRETDANFHQGSLYKLIFVDENGNYAFHSSELING